MTPFGSLDNVSRAGEILRRAQLTQEHTPDQGQVRRARAVVEGYRSAHAAPLQAANMGLRSCLATEGFETRPSQRLKRMPAIEAKLQRLTWLDLSIMQDIGGCRAVLATQEQVYQVEKRFRRNSYRRNGQHDTIRNYVDEPRSSGYRAIHIHTEYHDRRIEVQLRTRDQDLWAKFVEGLTSTTGVDFKNGAGPNEIHTQLREMAVMLSSAESYHLYPDDIVDVLTKLVTIAVADPTMRSRYRMIREGT